MIMTFRDFALNQSTSPLCHLVEWVLRRKDFTDPEQFQAYVAQVGTPRAKIILEKGIINYRREHECAAGNDPLVGETGSTA